MANELTIRKAGITETDLVHKMSVETFVETFAAQNTKENMDLFLEECFNRKAILSELLDKNIAYFIAFINGSPAGYVKIKEGGYADFSNEKALEIARIYVYEKYHGQKIGAALMQFVIDYAKSHSLKILWLGVWEHNPKAIAFYERWGFEKFDQHVFRLGTDDQNDFLYKKLIKD